ncbi:MAG: ComEA family DNA-binding protein [Achromobacter sp.]
MHPLFEFNAAQVRDCPARRRPPRLGVTRVGPGRLRQALGALLLTAGLSVAAPPANALDVNQASAQQLEGIRGIGPRTAEIIVSERERGGKFDSFEDLAERVRGIGLKKAQALESAGLQVGPGGAASAGAGAVARSSLGANDLKPTEAKPAAKAAAAKPAKPAMPGAKPAALKAQAPSRP